MGFNSGFKGLICFLSFSVSSPLVGCNTLPKPLLYNGNIIFDLHLFYLRPLFQECNYILKQGLGVIRRGLGFSWQFSWRLLFSVIYLRLPILMIRAVESSKMSEHVHLIKRTWRHIPENSNISYASNHHVYTWNVPLHTKGYHVLVCRCVY